MTENISARADFEWMLKSFVEENSGVVTATAVSSDGLLIGSSSEDRDSVDQMAAVVAGMTSLARGAVDFLEHDHLSNVLIETSDGFMFISQISDGSALAVLTTLDCDLGLVGYEITLLVERVGSALTPELLAEFKNLLSV